eukprot:TRINITY_DN9301_c0_g1_i1.p1 TRINITY_DN9301_c0_g1~~TRINITY_DN9301_c0_g1_i1.p1  ORF type:complete len:1084 (+),score=128.14 TRINITY_DN9301_c0_g1_i1:33-3254(+)
MEASTPPQSILSLVGEIASNAEQLLQTEPDDAVQQWVNSNLLPSLAWLSREHLSSCVPLSSTLSSSVVYSLSAILMYLRDLIFSLREQKSIPAMTGRSSDVAKNVTPRTPRLQGKQEMVPRKLRQMNLMVFSITSAIFSLLHESLEFLKKRLTPVADPHTPRTVSCIMDASTMRGADMEVFTAITWATETEYTLCITLVSRADVNIENCVATITNNNGTAGTLELCATHYPVTADSENSYRIHFGVIPPKQRRNFLIAGKQVDSAAFTVTIHDNLFRWDDVRAQSRLQQILSKKLGVNTTDIHVLHCFHVPEGDNEFTYLVCRLFSPHARSLVRQLEEGLHARDLSLLRVMDIREGMPEQWGQPEVSISVCSAALVEQGIPSRAHSGDVVSPVRTRAISFCPLAKVERYWDADVCLADPPAPTDPATVAEETFRQEVAGLLPAALKNGLRPDYIITQVHSLLEQFPGISHSAFVKEVLFNLHLYGDDVVELGHIANSISQQTHAGGRQELFSTALRSAAYQQAVNIYMNLHILKNHLSLTSPENQQQISQELNSTAEDEGHERARVQSVEDADRTALRTAFLDELAHLSRLNPRPAPQPVLQPGGGAAPTLADYNPLRRIEQLQPGDQTSGRLSSCCALNSRSSFGRISTGSQGQALTGRASSGVLATPANRLSLESRSHSRSNTPLPQGQPRSAASTPIPAGAKQRSHSSSDATFTQSSSAAKAIVKRKQTMQATTLPTTIFHSTISGRPVSVTTKDTPLDGMASRQSGPSQRSSSAPVVGSRSLTPSPAPVITEGRPSSPARFLNQKQQPQPPRGLTTPPQAVRTSDDGGDTPDAHTHRPTVRNPLSPKSPNAKPLGFDLKAKWLALSAESEVEKPKPRTTTSFTAAARKQKLATRTIVTNMANTPSAALTRRELMKIREEQTRLRVKKKEVEQRKRVDTIIHERLTGKNAKAIPVVRPWNRREAFPAHASESAPKGGVRRRSDGVAKPTSPHAELKADAYRYVPVQPPPPPPTTRLLKAHQQLATQVHYSSHYDATDPDDDVAELVLNDSETEFSDDREFGDEHLDWDGG